MVTFACIFFYRLHSELYIGEPNAIVFDQSKNIYLIWFEHILLYIYNIQKVWTQVLATYEVLTLFIWENSSLYFVVNFAHVWFSCFPWRPSALDVRFLRSSTERSSTIIFIVPFLFLITIYWSENTLSFISTTEGTLFMWLINLQKRRCRGI